MISSILSHILVWCFEIFVFSRVSCGGGKPFTTTKLGFYSFEKLKVSKNKV